MTNSVSVYLDLVRFGAALTVFFRHANYNPTYGVLPIIWRFQGFGWDAVMVFFVLSGFVIAYVSDSKEKTLYNYTISRFARLYSVTIPALLITLLLESIGFWLAPEAYGEIPLYGYSQLNVFIANLLFVHEIWNFSCLPFSNGTFWSLGYEFWYYFIFAIGFYISSYRKYIYLCFAILFVGPKILVLMPVWLLGVLTYYITLKSNINEVIGWVCFLGSIIAYILYRQFDAISYLNNLTRLYLGNNLVHSLHWSRDFLRCYLVGLLFAVNIIGVTTISFRIHKILELIESPVRYLASYTFTIYLLHEPLIKFFAAITYEINNLSLKVWLIMTGTSVCIWFIGAITEHKKNNVKRILEKCYDAFLRLFNRRII